MIKPELIPMYGRFIYNNSFFSTQMSLFQATLRLQTFPNTSKHFSFLRAPFSPRITITPNLSSRSNWMMPRSPTSAVLTIIARKVPPLLFEIISGFQPGFPPQYDSQRSWMPSLLACFSLTCIGQSHCFSSVTPSHTRNVTSFSPLPLGLSPALLFCAGTTDCQPTS